jgi:predicted MFS family arabinose efflux permease
VAVLAAVLFGLQELGTAIMNVGSVTTRQQLIPRDFYGRVGSVHRLFVATAAPLGALAGGFVADTWGVRPAMMLAGALNLAVLAALAPAVRRHLPSAGRPVAGAGASG